MILPFSHAFCLNLDKNEQTRWPLVKAEFDRVRINVQRINCVESLENRFISFNQSHYNTVAKGYATGLPFAIFEDDVLFDEWRHIEQAGMELPEDWDLLYLGGNFLGNWTMPYRYSPHLCVLPNAWQSHAIIYSINGAKFVLDNFNADIITAENPVYDEWLRVNTMPRLKTFIISPMICHQRPVHSDVWQTFADYTSVHIDGNKYLRSI